MEKEGRSVKMANREGMGPMEVWDHRDSQETTVSKESKDWLANLVIRGLVVTKARLALLDPSGAPAPGANLGPKALLDHGASKGLEESLVKKKDHLEDRGLMPDIALVRVDHRVAAMSLSRLVPSKGAQRLLLVPVQSRGAAHAALKAEDEEPGFFQKVSLRFRGVPLKGESQRPKSMFDDIGKEWSAPEPLPEVPKDFKEYPERDLVNYPYPARPMYPPKTRLLMVPDSWCTPLQKITGTSGPYLFFGGLFAFLVNKELWVYEEQGHMTAGWILFYLLISKSVGFRLDKYLYGEYQNRMNYFKGLIQEDLKDATEFRKTSALETDSLSTVKDSFPTIMKENMELQLEATYRKNVSTISTELQRRLNYLKDTEDAKSRFERDLMLKWIVNGVEQQAKDPKFKDQFLSNSIQQLKGLKVNL
ncbi:unnamed protein product, partial [Mesorhabditis spiculigera]